jgi:hypothetical protein
LLNNNLPASARIPATVHGGTTDDADAVCQTTAGGKSTETGMVTLQDIGRTNEKRLTADAVSL